jgi:hypothetical protein
MSVDFSNNYRLTIGARMNERHYEVEIVNFASVDPDAATKVEKTFEGDNAHARALAFLLSYIAPPYPAEPEVLEPHERFRRLVSEAPTKQVAS